MKNEARVTLCHSQEKFRYTSRGLTGAAKVGIKDDQTRD